MERLDENCGKVSLFMGDNSKLNSQERQVPYTTYDFRDGKLVTGSK